MGLTINPEAKIASKGQEHISQNRGCYDLETKYIPKAPLLWACSPADSAILRGTRNYEVGLGLRNQITRKRPWEYTVSTTFCLLFTVGYIASHAPTTMFCLSTWTLLNHEPK